MLLTNAVLTDGAMARAIITMTEAKTAALEDLKVPSSYTKSVQATGTGTDSVIIVSGVTGPAATYTGGHSKIGEMIGMEDMQMNEVEQMNRSQMFFDKKIEEIRYRRAELDYMEKDLLSFKQKLERRRKELNHKK